MTIGLLHIGRHWPDTYRRPGVSGPTIEEECPCPVEPCGHVSADKIVPDCPQHTGEKTIRSSHLADECPARPE